MKDIGNNLTKVILACVVLKTIDFENMNILDYLIIILSIVWSILFLINKKRRDDDANR